MKAVSSRDEYDCCADSAVCLPADALSVRSPLVSGRDSEGRPYRLSCNDIHVNGTRLEGPAVWLPSVVTSLFAEGEHFLFTCGCGDPGCEMIFEGVHVQRRRHRIDWLVPDPIHLPPEVPLENLGKPRRKGYLSFSFDRRQAEDAVRASLEQNLRGLRSMHGDYPTRRDLDCDNNGLTPYMFRVSALRSLVRQMGMRWTGPRVLA